MVQKIGNILPAVVRLKDHSGRCAGGFKGRMAGENGIRLEIAETGSV